MDKDFRESIFEQCKEASNTGVQTVSVNNYDLYRVLRLLVAAEKALAETQAVMADLLIERVPNIKLLIDNVLANLVSEAVEEFDPEMTEVERVHYGKPLMKSRLGLNENGDFDQAVYDDSVLADRITNFLRGKIAIFANDHDLFLPVPSVYLQPDKTLRLRWDYPNGRGRRHWETVVNTAVLNSPDDT